MKDLKLDNYLVHKQDVKDLINALNKVKSKEDLIIFINKLSTTLTSLKIYLELKGYIELTEKTIEIMKDLKEEKEVIVEEAIWNLRKKLEGFYSDLSKEVQIDMYFYGKNTHNLINKRFLKANVYKLENFYEINYINDSSSRKVFRVLLIDENIEFTKELKLEDKFDGIFDFSKIKSNLFEVSRNVYKCDYDFNYLKNELECSYNEDIETIVVGNGYATSGIDKNLLSSKAVNLSLPSQDIENSFEIAKKAISKNPNINKCIIGIGYYSLYYSLKKSNKFESRRALREIYKPLLHNDYSGKEDIISIEDYITNPLILELFNMDELSIYLNSINHTLNPDYFNEYWTREKNTVLKGRDFELMHDDDKFSTGIWRATQHNKLSKKSSKRNEMLLEEFIKYLEDNNVAPVLVVFPTTSYYNRFIDEKYEKVFNQVVERLNKNHKLKTINFNYNCELDDSDFIDVDHLNERGSIKLTSHLNKLLVWLKN
ncbi:MAG: hypothetical protein IJ086_00260 [Clostridium sp.]|nr:hypothetical protein [Clostridium sp.]